MLPIPNIAITNAQFQSTYAKASAFANATVDETADKLATFDQVIGKFQKPETSRFVFR